MPKYDNVSCSQCGAEFGPGDHGFSHCENHRYPVRVAALEERIEALTQKDILLSASLKKADARVKELEEALRELRAAVDMLDDKIGLPQSQQLSAAYMKACAALRSEP